MSGVTLVATTALSFSLFGTKGNIVPNDWLQWMLIGGLILGPQLVGHNGLNYVLKFLPASVVTATTLLEPVGAAVLAFVFLFQVPGVAEIQGGVIVLLGVLLATWPRKQRGSRGTDPDLGRV